MSSLPGSPGLVTSLFLCMERTSVLGRDYEALERANKRRRRSEGDDRRGAAQDSAVSAALAGPRPLRDRRAPSWMENHVFFGITSVFALGPRLGSSYSQLLFRCDRRDF